MSTETNPQPIPLSSRRRRPPTRWLAAAAAAVVVLVGVGIVAVNNNDDGPGELAGPPLQLSLGEGDAMQSCIAPDATILADMAPAFAATATAVEGEAVTLHVDRWYAGGDAEVVELYAPAGLAALTGTIDFQVGGSYLITASGDTVNYCGMSGTATPELQAMFDEAFGG